MDALSCQADTNKGQDRHGRREFPMAACLRCVLVKLKSNVAARMCASDKIACGSTYPERAHPTLVPLRAKLTTTLAVKLKSCAAREG